MSDPTPNNERRWVCRWADDPDRPTCFPTLQHVGCGYVDAVDRVLADREGDN